jgi:hypothetical protein
MFEWMTPVLLLVYDPFSRGVVGVAILLIGAGFLVRLLRGRRTL